MKPNQRGLTLIELLIVLAIAGFLLTTAAYAMEYARRTVALVAATAELRSTFHQTRAMAITHRRSVAIRFRAEGDSWSWRVYEDRDNDGVRNDDIARGIDVPIGPDHTLHYTPARIGVPDISIPDPATGQPLGLRLPVRFGNSQLCSFSREGESTNGSLVLTDGRNVRVISIEGDSALVRVQRWDGRKWITSE
jgi:prepilin-type N-terminal cleavage/methylation domain-containing protein